MRVKEENYQSFLEIRSVIDVLYFVRARQTQIVVIIHACDAETRLLLAGGTFDQLQEKTQTWES